MSLWTLKWQNPKNTQLRFVCVCESYLAMTTCSSPSHMKSPPKQKETKKKKKSKNTKHTLPEVKKLGIELLSSTTHINNLPILISIIDNPSSPPHFLLESLLSLQSFFTPLLPTIPSSSSSSKKTLTHDSADFIYLTWLRSKFDQLAQSLIELSISQSCEATLKVFLLPIFLLLIVLYIIWFFFISFVLFLGSGSRYHNGVC